MKYNHIINLFLISSILLASVQCECEYQFTKERNTLSTPMWFNPKGILLIPDKDGKIKLSSGSVYLQCSYVPLNDNPVNKIILKDNIYETVQLSCKRNKFYIAAKPPISLSTNDLENASCERDQLIHVWDGAKMNSLFQLSQTAKDKCKTYDSILRNTHLWNGIGLYTHKFHNIPLVENCLSIATSTPLFAVHHLKMKTNDIGTNKEFGFSRGPTLFFPEFNPDSSYQQNNQEKALKKLLGNSLYSRYFSSKNLIFQRGHLVPNGDFQLDILRKATYYYSNSSPQINKINIGHWKLLETAIRKLSKQLEIITGGAGILSFGNKEIRLNENRLPAPEYFWKIIRDENQHVMGFYIKNYPNENPQTHCINYEWILPTTIECFMPDDTTIPNSISSLIPQISHQGPLKGN